MAPIVHPEPRRRRRGPERRWDTALPLGDQLAQLGCRRVGILGGEPLLRSDVGELIDHVRARGMACVLTSNGLMVPRRIEELRSLSTLVLSLDAPGPANDAQRGAGVFAAVQRALAAARAAAIPVKLNAVMSARTAPHLDALLAFCEAHDLHVTVNVMRSGAPDLWHQAATLRAEDEAIRRLLERLADLARTNSRLLFSEVTYRYAMRWGDYARDRYEEHELAADDPRRRDGPRCQAGRYYLSIDPDGTAYPCVATAGRITGGNVVADGVEAAWRRLHGHGCVACYSPCLVEQNLPPVPRSAGDRSVRPPPPAALRLTREPDCNPIRAVSVRVPIPRCRTRGGGAGRR